jgi:hypothetical protein
MQAEAMMSSRAMSDRPQGRYLPDKIIVTDRVEVVFKLLPKLRVRSVYRILKDASGVPMTQRGM